MRYRKPKRYTQPNFGWVYSLLPILLILGGIYFVYKKITNMFDADKGGRTQGITNEHQQTVIDNIKKSTGTPSSNHIIIADRIHKYLDVVQITGVGSWFSQTFTNLDQKQIPEINTKNAINQLFAPNCITYGDVQKVIVAYGIRRHENRENLLFGFLWDSHKMSLLDALESFGNKKYQPFIKKLANKVPIENKHKNIYYSHFN